MLYTLEHGTVISKPAAGRWAMGHLPPRFAPLIERALAYRLTAQDIPATQAFLRYTLERSRQSGLTSTQPPPSIGNA
jgi:hypothetical protein